MLDEARGGGGGRKFFVNTYSVQDALSLSLSLFFQRRPTLRSLRGTKSPEQRNVRMWYNMCAWLACVVVLRNMRSERAMPSPTVDTTRTVPGMGNQPANDRARASGEMISQTGKEGKDRSSEASASDRDQTKEAQARASALGGAGGQFRKCASGRERTRGRETPAPPQ